MSPSPSLCLHLPLLLLLLTSSASSLFTKNEPETQTSATPANCTTGYVNGGGSQNETDPQMTKSIDGLEEVSINTP
ncbi:hypothetical protein OYC64_010072 [Pagothenia borchgrevinki]|uniref:Uncharacterized protein n=1 Tax=Pagothenia borchgrevinki TaxID=8213 RepID=A0ABD2H8A7_PAGBO